MWRLSQLGRLRSVTCAVARMSDICLPPPYGVTVVLPSLVSGWKLATLSIFIEVFDKGGALECPMDRFLRWMGRLLSSRKKAGIVGAVWSDFHSWGKSWQIMRRLDVRGARGWFPMHETRKG
jgi:hypothetical protein